MSGPCLNHDCIVLKPQSLIYDCAVTDSKFTVFLPYNVRHIYALATIAPEPVSVWMSRKGGLLASRSAINAIRLVGWQKHCNLSLKSLPTIIADILLTTCTVDQVV